jgi:hydroxymethylglutaryl-CoA lyase
MSDLPRFVQINEEGPREGFQIEKGPIPTARKIQLVDALSETGLSSIQVVSFVNPRRVPGMADADEVAKGFRRKPGVHYNALWLNDKGFERAVAAKVFEVTGRIALTASEKFLLRNQQRSTRDDLAAQQEMVKLYEQYKVPVDHGYVMAAFGCNFEGDIAPAKVLDMVQQIVDLAKEREFEIKNLTLADTMAWATPLSIKRLVCAVRDRFPHLRITLHLHDTRGMGIANAYAGLECGVDSFDAAVAGLGGCPFAAHAGAAGNVCTEDLVFMLQEMGIETRIDLEKLIETARLAEEIVGHPLPGSVMKSGSLKSLRQRSTAVVPLTVR